MRIQLLSIACALTLNFYGQGFSNINTNWGMPNGGRINGGVPYGFNNIGNTAFSFDNPGSQTWATMDINGDSRPDLIVASQLQGGNVTCFSPGLNQYWNVYMNTGSGFATSAIQWSLPNGGRVTGGIIFGFDNVSGSASQSDNSGSQSWQLTDMNGDNKADLVITAQLQAGNITCFSPGSGQYWKVYLNTGTGFSSSVTNWNLPNGGKITSGITYGYNSGFGSAQGSDNVGSQSWTLTDMDGDSKPDLMVTAQLQAGYVTCFSPGSGQYWKLYTNNGTGFNATPTNWNLPNGGKLSGGITYGYNSITGLAASGDNTGSQTWSLVDMDGDKKSDLLIAAQLQAGYVTCFSPGSGQYWKVFVNNGTGFAASPTNWNLPNGGKITGGVTYGYNSISGLAVQSDNTGSQSWMLMDMNGYNAPELVVTAQHQGGQVTCFSPGSGQYWKVYANNTGFSTLPFICTLPAGGKLSGGVTFGFDNGSGTALSSNNPGSQSWAVMEMTGDNIADLVVCGQLQGGNVTTFSPASEQYWKVYKSDFVTGIKENGSHVKTFNVFPNPNNGSFNIQSSIEENIIISNEVGQAVKTVTLSQLNDFSAEINGLQNGVYFISGKNTQSKIVVIR